MTKENKTMKKAIIMLSSEPENWRKTLQKVLCEMDDVHLVCGGDDLENEADEGLIYLAPLFYEAAGTGLINDVSASYSDAFACLCALAQAAKDKGFELETQIF